MMPRYYAALTHRAATVHRVAGPAATLLAAAVAMCLIAIIFARPAAAFEIEPAAADGVAFESNRVRPAFASIEVAIHDQIAATKATYQVRNDTESEVEITCHYALTATELVDGFRYWNGDEEIVGEVLERETAAAIYEDLTGQRRDPGLLEQIGHRFRFRVFPVAPKELKPIELRTLAALPFRAGVVEYVVPRENLLGGAGVFSLVVDITDDLPIIDLETLGFDGVVKRFGPHHRRVVFEGRDIEFASDLKIRYRVAADDYALRLVTHRDPDTEGDGTFMLLVSPKADVKREEVIGRDIVFVMDVSGSMHGLPLWQTKEGLAGILGQLNADDRFEIVAFDDEVRPFFAGLREVDGAAVTEARTRVGALESGGGTHIRDALVKALEILAADPRPHRPRAIVFLTDGMGTQPPEKVLSEIRGWGDDVRLYTFGVGDSVNRSFLERLARENRGLATFIGEGDRIDAEMQRVYDRIAETLMVDLELEMEGLATHAIYPKPDALPDLYRDDQLVIFGRYRRGAEGVVRLTGRSHDEPKTLDMHVELPEADAEHAHIEKLWAKRRIDHLMDGIAERGVGDDGDDELVREVTRLGIVHNLVTPYTAFLAVPASLQTQAVKDRIRQGRRGYDKRLVDSLEGIKLSQSHIPPGDPVLSVEAPADAQRVVAWFPFGLRKRLAWDSIRERWSVRFLVPRHARDGVYTIRVQIVHAERTVEWREIEYVIDGTAPEFEAEVPDTITRGQPLTVRVDPFEPVGLVEVYTVGETIAPIRLALDPETGWYTGELELPEVAEHGDIYTVRVVVRDRARNRFEQDLAVEVVERQVR